MTRPPIPPKSDLIPWLIALREAPIDYVGEGGIARLYADLENWRAAQDRVDDMIDVGTHMVHPRRHGLDFVLSAPEHFKGYYGTPDTRDIWVETTNWGDFLPKLSANEDEALTRFWGWLDLFIEIHGLTPSPARPIIRDARPYFDLVDMLERMHKDPTLRPGDGSIRAAHVYIHDICKDRSHRLSEFATILRDNITAMMDHICNDLLRKNVEGGLDAMAAAMRPDGDPWGVFINVVRRLHANHRGMHSRYGGVRDLIKG